MSLHGKFSEGRSGSTTVVVLWSRWYVYESRGRRGYPSVDALSKFVAEMKQYRTLYPVQYPIKVRYQYSTCT